MGGLVLTKSNGLFDLSMIACWWGYRVRGGRREKCINSVGEIGKERKCYNGMFTI